MASTASLLAAVIWYTIVSSVLCATEVYLPSQHINSSTVPWYYCGFYGLSYRLQCDNLTQAYITPMAGCLASLNTSMPCWPQNYTNTANCIDSAWCSGSLLVQNSDLLCLGVFPSSTQTAGQLPANITCDIALSVETSPILQDVRLDSSSWPAWQIIVVAVAGSVALLLAVALMVMLMLICIRHHNKVQQVLQDPYDMTYQRAMKNTLEATTRSTGSPISTPATYFSVQPPSPVAAQPDYSAHTSTHGSPSRLPPLSHPSLAPQTGMPPPWLLPPSGTSPAKWPTPFRPPTGPRSVHEAVSTPHSPMSPSLSYPPQYYTQQRG